MIETKPFVEIYETPPDLVGPRKPVKSRFVVKHGDFEPEAKWTSKSKKTPANSSYVIIGFDTEYKTPDHPLELEDIKAGKGNYRVLSYQFHCETNAGVKWSGIACPKDDERMSFGQFLVFALASGIRDKAITMLPTNIYLVGHFTRADVPAFADFRDLIQIVNNVRNTFISIGRYVAVDIKFHGKKNVRLKVSLRDTMLLAPEGSKSLSALGDLVSAPKIVLNKNPAKELYFKQNMDVLRRNDWDLFRRYALNDAVICVEYLKQMISLYQSVTGETKAPVTLSSIGVDLLLKSWTKSLKIQPNDILGKEDYTEHRYDKKKGYYVKQQKTVSINECFWHESFVTECFHGGRNEQFWFGPAFEAEWNDYDLSSAYATAMSLIGQADWRTWRPESGWNSVWRDLR